VLVGPGGGHGALVPVGAGAAGVLVGPGAGILVDTMVTVGVLVGVFVKVRVGAGVFVNPAVTVCVGVEVRVKVGVGSRLGLTLKKCLRGAIHNIYCHP